MAGAGLSSLAGRAAAAFVTVAAVALIPFSSGCGSPTTGRDGAGDTASPGQGVAEAALTSTPVSTGTSALETAATTAVTRAPSGTTPVTASPEAKSGKPEQTREVTPTPGAVQQVEGPTPTLLPSAAAQTAVSPTPDVVLATSTPEPLSLAPIAVWEGEITLNTYGWEQGLVPTDQSDPIHPYPRLDFGAVTGPAPRTYRAVFVENEYVQLTILPGLGGRILRWVDRTTGRQLFYSNPVIKPTRWGARGWWLATGGMEWSFPTDEHGLNEYRLWDYQLLWNGVRVWDTDDRTGLTVEVTVWLDRERSYFSIAPRITNPTVDAKPYQFWSNAMLTLSGQNVPSPELRFVLPANAVTVHSTGDATLPGPGGQMAWPVHDGRDFSRFSEWRRPLGLFARPALAGFVGAYDPSADQGIVRVFPHASVTGVKVFCLGDLGSELWTDDGGRYFELWGGLTPTFWEYWSLQPGASVLWTERWYPVSGIGGFDWANEEGAIRLVPSGDRVELAVVTTRALDASIVLLRDGSEVQRWDARLAPGRPFRAISNEASGGGDWTVQVIDRGEIIAQMGP